MRNDPFVEDVLAGFREDVRDMESIVEIGPLLQTALERLERRIPREEARQILMEEFFYAQRD